MAQKKYISLNRLSDFLDNLKANFATLVHKHTISDITDYKVDATLSPTSVNPVQNKVIDAEFEAISEAMNVLELAIDEKASSSHTHDDIYYTESEIDSKLSTKANSSHTHSIADTTNLQSTLDGKVPTTRTINNKSLSENITLSASDVGAATSSHDHNNLYYTESEIDTKLATKSDTTHKHDDLYDTKGAAANSLVSAKEYTDTKTSGLASTSSVNTSISTHNTSASSHNDIRDLISGLTNRLNALADSDDTTLDQFSEIVAYIKSNKSLIDSITTSKVNVADIIDNLTTNVTNKPLSAAQGVAIKALIDALQLEVDSKANSTHTHTVSDITDLTATATELNYMDGVTSNVQTQLDEKVSDTDLTYGVDSSIQTVSARYARVAFGAGKFIALPYRADANSKFLYSTNGVEWNEINAPVNAAWRDIVYGDNKFVAVSSTTTSGGYYGAYSYDGLSWTLTTLPSGGSPNALAYGNGRFVYVGSNTATAYSTDGINWTQVLVPSSSYSFYSSCIAYGNGKFIAPYASGGIYFYTTDGINWATGTFPSGSYSRIIYANGKFVAIGNNSMAYSEDGDNWTKITPPTSTNWYAIAYGGGKFIVLGFSSSNMIYSSDGINWELTTIAESNSWCDLAFGNGVFVAVTEGAYSLLTIVFGNKYGLAYQSDVEQHITTAIANKVDKTDIPQSDWNQNNVNAVDYIKNRTHWVERNFTQVLSDKSISNGTSISELRTISAPDSCIVTLDGVQYQCDMWVNSTGEYCFGDSRIVTRYDWDAGTEVIDTSHPENTPFYISVCGEDDGISWDIVYDWYVMFNSNIASTAHTISISVSTGEGIYHTLDERFIPSAVARTSAINAISDDLNETQLQMNTKASVATVTQAEYNALEQAEATNANTLYMITDAEEENYCTSTEVDEKINAAIGDLDSVLAQINTLVGGVS